jgi:uncharacterized membrane protein YjdF
MTQDGRHDDAPQPAVSETAATIHHWVVVIIVAVMAIDLVLVLLEQQWFSALLILTIGALLLGSTLTRQRMSVRIPYEFQLMALIFVFAALFLGEIRDYYDRFWWWDIALHTASGFLLGIFGFLLVYLLNESKVVAMQMLPRFVALFAFMFAVSVGAVWEIFEYSMDGLVGTQMQKPMLGDASGLTDTMWDLIVDTLGALSIALLGWWHMASRRRSFVDDWIQKFIDQNPRLFQRRLLND